MHGEIEWAFQAIVNTYSQDVIGFEALARPAWGNEAVSPDTFFRIAERFDFTLQADWACMESLLEKLQTIVWPMNARLFLNVYARTFKNKDKMRVWLERFYRMFPQTVCVFEGHDRTWKPRELTMIEKAPTRIQSVLTLGRDLGLRIHEVHRIDTSIARRALREGVIEIKGKGGLVRRVPLRGEAKKVLEEALKVTKPGQKLFVPTNTKTHEAIRQVQSYIHSNRPPESTVTFHGLRHGYGRDMYMELCAKAEISEREALERVSELMGHHRGEVTKIYLGSLM